MADWKLLGEVPDSEDDDAFDSPEIPAALVDTAAPAPANTVQIDEDVWEFPDSQNDIHEAPKPYTPLPLPSHNGSLSSSPLSSARSMDGLPEFDDMLLDGVQDGEVPEVSNHTGNSQISGGIYIELPNRAPTAFEDMSHDGVPEPRDATIDDEIALASQELGLIETATDPQREAVRLERSLRPRKPIQEHPYLLENAHYSSLFRKHGMRPVQMAIARAKAAREENAQDADFQDDSQGNSLPELNNSSQLFDSNEVDESVGLFNFPSSSPPKTSPWISHGRSSNHGSSQGDTDNTSVPDQDLPALSELLSNSRRKISPGTKRASMTAADSSARKRRRHDIVDSDPVDVDISGHDSHTKSSLGAGPLPPIPRLQLNARQLVDTPPTKAAVTITNNSSSEDEAAGDEGSPARQARASPEPTRENFDYMNRIGKRIKGVLPASWLRLDQQASREKAQKDVRQRQRNRTPEREVRRGVAQTRTANNVSTSSRLSLFFDESDEDERETAAPKPATTDDAYQNQTRILLVPDETPTLPIDVFSDDGSVIEHDTIDTMFSEQTQKSKSNDKQRLSMTGISSIKKAYLKPRQPKITASLSRTKSSSGTLPKKRGSNKQSSSNKPVPTRRPVKRPAPKPLSVLDVIEPGAPRFLKIAARTAKTRVNQGRSSPSKKFIRLASRRDHIDAVSALHAWKAGSIPQRQEVSAARSEKRKYVSRTPLKESTVNRPSKARSTPKRPMSTTNKSRKFVKQTSNGGSARYLPSSAAVNPAPEPGTISLKDGKPAANTNEPAQNERSTERPLSDSLRPSRPAVLEADDSSKVRLLGFHRRKKFLDKIYRKNNRESSVDSSDTRSEISLDRLFTANLSRIQEENGDDIQPERQLQRRSRRKKARHPKRIDIDAPQFSHAADPLPISYDVEVEAERPQSASATAHASAKLLGLGPYGTQYTTHFEIFPLDPGVYFHESTLLGSGIITECQRVSTRQVLMNFRPRVVFQFGSYSCKWGEWNGQTSSELGIVLDLIAEELEKPDGISLSAESTVLEAAKYISQYATSALSFSDEAGIKSFIARVLEAVRGCHSRIDAIISGKSLSDRTCQTISKVYDRLLVLGFVSLSICIDDNNLMTEKFQAEDLLRTLATGSVASLLLMGIDQLKEAYAQLQSTAARERGLREDKPAIHSWALVMQILETSHIPRGSLWDVLKQKIASNDQVARPDAQSYEKIWETIFAVLPISEFSSSGVLVPGKRYEAAADGWAIVQLLLRQVFTVYRENTRQAPSYNNYCRAIMSRCHYLVQQWGWRRSGSVVGAIFDFFGSQNLEHLRNEEVNASPLFLEQLSGEPSLAVEPGDKCFHIFLKLLALSIQKLRSAGSIKDVRNLVARTIPNHNRQHLKEQTVHERDLAALRNHHDLLATLFWAAPADIRPSVTLLERLVAPETSHKEASLINIRCWTQLARFIIAKGEASTAFKPFHLWRNGFFQKMVQQFDSAAADIQQQLLALPSEVRHTVSEEMINSMVAMNKGAASDVLHACITASLHVMKHAADLEAATFCLNTLQLQHIYKQFAIYPPELPWDTLRAAVSSLDIFLAHITEFKENEESQQSESQILNSAQADDALLLLDHEISKSYFSMVRCSLSNTASTERSTAEPEPVSVREHGTTVAVRLAACFINGGLIRLHDLFKRGKYGLFDSPIHKLDLEQRQYLDLVMITLLNAGIDDFMELDFTLCELWLLLLIRPNSYLKHEHRLVEALRRRGEYFVPATNTGLTNSPNYECNRTLFEFAISAMRHSIRDAGPNMKRTLTTEHGKALKLVMERMRDDLKATSSHPVTHVPYVAFARQIISLIRMHGSEICTLDNFYYQISKDYSPSAEDPQLQVAAMVSYGLRLREGDTRVVQQVFFFLFNNFKMAVISDSLKEEKVMLRGGMAEDIGITRFILGKMLPAIIGAISTKPVAYPLLDLYMWAVRHRLRRRSVMTYYLSDADLPTIKSVLQAILMGLERWGMEQAPLTAVNLHTLGSLCAAINLLWPAIYEYSLNTDASPVLWSDILALLSKFNLYVTAMEKALESPNFRSLQMRFDEIFATLSATGWQSTRLTDSDVEGFTDNIEQDVDRNWFEVDGRISIQTPGKPRGGTNVHGISRARWDTAALVNDMQKQLQDWQFWKRRMDGETTSSRNEPVMIMF